MAKTAVLSNVNMNLVIRLLQRQTTVYQTEGYGNELGILRNPASSYHAFAPEVTFFLMDLMELLEHELQPDAAKVRIENWFADLEAGLQQESVYYISDAYLWGNEIDALFDSGRKAALEQLWQGALESLCERHHNVRILPYRRLIEKMGESNAFSLKMWYMGKVLLSNEAQKQLAECILQCLEVEARTPKKVLLLDLDNTLWGGLAGEHDVTEVVLSDDHTGLAYKNLQRVILQMQRQGVLLAIVSKNNEADAMELIANHPHMVLRADAFAAKKINWQPKHESIRELAAELNLGTDSFVFFDDNPTERELVRSMLPEVAVPEFPEKPEDLAPAMIEIYKKYFQKATLTAEDLAKTKQYEQMAKRVELERAAGSFEDYLRSLEIVIHRVDPAKNVERFGQLLNKTNQFNLTTNRYSAQEAAALVSAPEKRVFLYRVEDKFGDNGIVAALIADLSDSEGKAAVITDFVMSCRVMGKQIEDAILADVEKALRDVGCIRVSGLFVPSAKNAPVAGLYERLGYAPDGEGRFTLELQHAPERMYAAKFV